MAPNVTLHHGDCRPVLLRPDFPRIDSIVIDPPSGIGFMGAEWDSDRGGPDQWIAWLATRIQAAARHLPPGGVAVVWALPRTSHWTAQAIEAAGLVLEDRVASLFSGDELYEQFLASLDPEQLLAWERVLNALDPSRLGHIFGNGFPKGSAKLKPAIEDWWLARKPGGDRYLDIDSSRVPGTYPTRKAGFKVFNGSSFQGGAWRGETHPNGRHPAHLVMQHAGGCSEDVCAPDCPAAAIATQSGERPGGGMHPRANTTMGYGGNSRPFQTEGYEDTGTAARFFPSARPDDDEVPFRYVSKASGSERDAGVRDLRWVKGQLATHAQYRQAVKHNEQVAHHRAAAKAAGVPYQGPKEIEVAVANPHPTVKPVQLMRWLIRLVTPPGGTVLDMFMGSGTTGVAAIEEDRNFVGIEEWDGAFTTARLRIDEALRKKARGKT